MVQNSTLPPVENRVSTITPVTNGDHTAPQAVNNRLTSQKKTKQNPLRTPPPT